MLLRSSVTRVGWIVALGGLVGAACSDPPPDSGSPALSGSSVLVPNQTVEDKIVGGRVEPGYPAVGALLDPQGGICSGTLVGPRHVLTAAHCFDYGTRGIRFVLGPRANQGTSYNVSAVWLHPRWNSRTMTNDIAIAELAGNPGVAPMPVAADLSRAAGANMNFVGFGITRGNASDSGTKRSVVMPIASLDATTFRYQVPGRNTCGGDSGGPAFYDVGGREYVAGVTSYGDQACRDYGVNTRADAFIDWIRQVVGPELVTSADPPGGPADPPAPGNPPADPPGDPAPAPPPQQPPAEDDPCEINGWYGDGECDPCPLPDPDCEPQAPPGGGAPPPGGGAPPPGGGDHCAINGWYGDGVCDDDCPQPDPDCGGGPGGPGGGGGVDPCLANGWYGDGECDVFCPQIDPDCLMGPWNSGPGDFCFDNWWYGDGECDRCPRFDPDCDPCWVNWQYGDGVCDRNCAVPDPDCR